jgi:hypothetical protein
MIGLRFLLQRHDYILFYTVYDFRVEFLSSTAVIHPYANVRIVDCIGQVHLIRSNQTGEGRCIGWVFRAVVETLRAKLSQLNTTDSIGSLLQNAFDSAILCDMLCDKS